MSEPTRLPRRDALLVEPGKVLNYLLAPEHEEGGPKAKFFRNRGFGPERWEEMARALRKHGETQPVVKVTENKWGTKFEVRCEIGTPDGRNPCIRTLWQVSGGAAPRLVTAYPGE